MKPTKKSNKYLTTAKIIVLSLILSASVSMVYAQWVGPTATPYGGNVPPPMNLGIASQTKIGFGWFAGIGSTLGAFINGLLETATIRISGGSPAAGAVLRASNNQGNASWAAPSFTCVPRTVTGLLGDAQSACQSGEVLTGGGGSCSQNILRVEPNTATNEYVVFCSGSNETASATAICCPMNFVPRAI